MSQIMNLVFDDNASVFDIKEINSSFAHASLRVMYLGDNRNGSCFSKESVIRALPTLKNVPIVCNYDNEANMIGAHDIALATDADGRPYIRNLTEPCGVVPEHATTEFVVDTDNDGNEHEYLVIHDVLLWKRQDVYRHIVNDLDGTVKHSMEINVNSGEKNSSGYYNVRDFEFTALCLLESAEPCFQGSQLELYSANHFKQKMSEMMAELKSTFSAVSQSDCDDHNDSIITEGGEKTLDSVNENIEMLETDTEVHADEDAPATEPVVCTSEESDVAESYAMTNNVVNELTRVLEEETIELAWGEFNRYAYIDCDIEAQEVYCCDAKDWLIYGFNYEVNGDAISINFESKKRKKFVIVDFEGDDQNSLLAGVFAKIAGACENMREVEHNFAEVSAQLDAANAELNTLRSFKLDVETKALEAARNEIFGRFTELAGIEEFEHLRENCDGIELCDLEEKCYAIMGRHNVVTKFAADTKAVKLAVELADDSVADNEPYGGLMLKYLNKNN